jgi:serine/threonine-protein kinase HipA
MVLGLPELGGLAFRRAHGDVSFAPAYDIAMHLHHKSASRTFATKINGKLEADSITADDLIAEARQWSISNRRAMFAVAETLHNLQAELAVFDLDRYPGVPAAALQVVKDHTRHLISQLPDDPATASRRVGAY